MSVISSSDHTCDTMPVSALATPPVVCMSKITKAFGATLANAEIDLVVSAGGIIGLVGGNGAGKSTLMRILSGALSPTLGTIAFGNEQLPIGQYDTAEAHRRGIRMVHQELSLCTNLTVAENFFIEAPADARILPGWRNVYKARARQALEALFPNSGIDVDARVGHLTIGERQMVEIARAAAAPGVKLIVLDEPTSSLDQERSRQLRAYIRKESSRGLAFIFISHKLQEVIEIASQVVVLRNGRLAWHGAVADASVDKLVQLMGGDAGIMHRHQVQTAAADGEIVIRVGGAFTSGLGHDLELRRGEIVGLAGLEGSGQKELLHAIFDATQSNSDVKRKGSVSFIAGDRQKEGVFPLWSVLSNISIGRIAQRRWLGLISHEEEFAAAAKRARQLQLDENRFQSNILELSGGNQQKALVARALVADTPTIVLDDPTRGVDISTKQDFYRLCNEAAREGHTLVWYTTEEAELLASDRVLVFSGGEIVSELSGAGLTEEAIVGASFAHTAQQRSQQANAKAPISRVLRHLVNAAPYIGLAMVLAIMFTANPLTASVFGLDLLLMPALSLVLITVAQMYVVGGSEIDLGVGAFVGLVSVLAATSLNDQPTLGVFAIALVIAGYSGLGWFVQARRIPAIVVTLGASFIWGGIGYTIQPAPGGSAPGWLTALVNWSVGFLPTSIILIASVAALSLLIDRMPLGVILRGFGNNAAAMVVSGWSAAKFAAIRYLIAGLFAAAAGLSLTAINTASDINSGNSYTLLSVAAVVMGGCTLLGGIISPLGAVVGAVTLSLIGALLGVLNVSSDFNAAAQGMVLIALLAMRSIVRNDRSEQ